MPDSVRQKWRPPLALVIGGTLGAVLLLPIIGIAWLRLAGNILGWAETAWLIAWIAVAATAVLAWLLWRLVLRPVWALTAHARAVKAGHAAPTTPSHFGTPELGELGSAVIEMGESLQNRARSVQAYADHVTHELKSPLTSLRGAAQMLQSEDLPAADRAALLDTIDVSAARMDQLLNDLRTHVAARESFAPGQTTLGSALALVSVPDPVNVRVVADGPVPMSAQDLSRVLHQLLRNAGEHGATDARLEVADATLRVADNGAGIPAGDRARVFDPFFTTRRADGGTGMGLAIAATLVRAAGGEIAVAGDAGQPGAVIELRF